MIKCKVCKKRFSPKKENKYIVQEIPTVTNVFTGTKAFEAFDCPKCGCQNIVGIREGGNNENRN